MKRCGLRLAALLLAALVLLLSPASASGAPAFTTGQTLPDAIQGVYYSTRIKASGSNPLTFSFAPGDYAAHSVPKGLTMNAEGLIYGTPQKAGSYQFVVEAADAALPAQTTSVFTLTVRPFDESALNAGGTDARVTGAGYDDLTGVANAPNGGLAAMGNGMLFFIGSKGHLMESTAPFRKASRTYGAVEYDCLDTLGNNLYYFHHYLAKRGEPASSFQMKGHGTIHLPATKNQYVTRIVQDSIGRKGRDALVTLDKRITNLSLTNEIVLYIQGGLLMRADVQSGKERTMRAYAAGREVLAASAFPYNGYAYCIGQDDGCLYRMPLDGQVAQQLTGGRVTAYTAALYQGAPALFYSDASQQLFRSGLDGSNPLPLEGLKAGALNADTGYVYFTNPTDGYAVYRLAPDLEIAERISQTAAKSIYVFDQHIALEPMGGSALVILSKDGSAETQLNR